MDYRRSSLRRVSTSAAIAVSVGLALTGCGGLSERPDDRPTMYYDLGQAWTTTKRQVRFYDCRTGSMICTGAAGYVDSKYQCRCE